MDKFTPVHFIFLTFGAAVISLKAYPSLFIANGLRDTWIALIIASLVIFVFFIYIINIWKNNNFKENPNIVEIYQYALGKKVGNILLFLFIMTLFLTLVEASSVEADSMHMNMSIETPKWLFAFFFIIPSIYVVKKNIVSIITICIIVITFIMISGINLAIFTTKYKEPGMLFPVFENGISLGFFISIIKILGLYGCINITLPFLSKLTHNKSKLNKYVIIALVIIIQIEIVSITGVLMTFTPERAVDMSYPKLVQTQLVSYFQFLDFGELYVMLQVLAGFMLKYLITFYSILIILRNYNVSRKALKIIPYFISAAVLICSILISKNSFILFDLINVYQYICLLNYIVVPFIVFTVIFIKQRAT